MNINNLSLKEKIGQRFIVGINNENTDDIIELIQNAHLGGVVLYKKNYHNYQEMLDLIKKLKNANKENKIPLFIAIDQEGGKVNRLPNEINNLINIYDFSKQNKKDIGKYANTLTNILAETGINMNFAPVIDIYNNSNSNVLYKRCFYGNSHDVLENGKEYIKNTNKQVISVIKHYPGHGSSKKDSHFIIPYIFDYKTILNKHIYPFNELMKKNADAIMIGHLTIRKLTNLLPASISNMFINKYIKNNYNGLVITDEINMLKRNLFYHYIYLNKALTSNNDIILIKIKNKNEFYQIMNKYNKLLNKNNNYLNNLNDNITNIINIKKKYNVNDNTNYKGLDINKINHDIDLINNK